MDYNLVWGIYWVLCWFCIVAGFVRGFEEWSIKDFVLSFLGSAIANLVAFSIGAKILNNFIG